MSALAVRILGGGLLALAAAAGGYEAGLRARRRVAELRALVLAVGIVRSEVAFAVSPLPEALARASRAAGGEVGGLLALWSQALGRSGAGPEAAYRAALGRQEARLALTPDDLLPLDELVQSLGRSDRDDQSLHLERAGRRLAALADRLEPEAERNARLMRALGLLGGVAAAILVL